MIKSKIQDKVAKLLRQAEDVVGTPEEAVFQAKAFELMAKYGLEQADIEATKRGLDTSDIPDAIKWEAKITGKYASQQVLLLHGMAMALHCKSVWSSNAKVLYVFGVPRHIERLQFLWDLLKPQMLRLVENVRPPQVHERRRYDYYTGTYKTVGGQGQVRSYRRAWIAGFAQTVSERVKAQESKALESAGGGALVLYRSDKERAEVALRATFPRLGKVKRTSYNSAGYAHGQRDGRNASFARAIA
ncbi:hypothetical protein SEA_NOTHINGSPECIAL_79 [Mycobacterium phage NothingSpecial]|nr:hypothetical protein SEA_NOTHINGSPECIAL_79 [Mycobacterium phage NothingSpecial]